MRADNRFFKELLIMEDKIMDKYAQLRASADVVTRALGDFSSTFEVKLGSSLLEQDEHEHRLLFQLVDLDRACRESTSQLLGFIEARYIEFREKAFEYLSVLHDGLDEDDPRREDYFWDNPAAELNYLDEHDFDDSYVEEGLRQIRRHPSFESAITAVSDEAFFEDENRQNYAIRCLRDPDLEG